MTQNDLIQHRLHNQQLLAPEFTEVGPLVHWLGAMQSQDYIQSKWAIGIRIPGLTDAAVEQAFADREIIRSWIMRGTLHTVAAEDIYWMLDLLAPRLIASGKGRNRQLGLDEATFSQANDLFQRILQGNKELTRDEMGAALTEAGISTEGQRLYHILHRAGLEQLICFGSRQGKQFTFTLLQDAVPNQKRLKKEEALAALAKRYFMSRAPASLEDFVWWSGLTLTDARKGLTMVQNLFEEKVIEGKSYWIPKDQPDLKAKKHPTLLLPAFDEYVIAYRDRSAALNADQTQKVISSNGIFYPVILEEGRVVGTWKRQIKKEEVLIQPDIFQELQGGIEVAGKGFSQFLGVERVVLD